MAEEKDEMVIPRAVITTFNKPFCMVRNDEEVWEFKPPYRYLFMSDHLKHAEEYVDTVSSLESCAIYRPLRAGANLVGRSIYVERHRDRGIGDLLFMTGVLNYIHTQTTGATKVYLYALSDRGQVLFNHPSLTGNMPYYGPTIIDSLSSFDYHWVVPSVTEHSGEKDQLNVYDALFRSVGLDPETIDPRFKRPTVNLDDKDESNVDSLFFFIYNDKNINLKQVPYYVVAPFCYSSLRIVPYATWLSLIKELGDQRPVIILGEMKHRLPAPDMTAADFVQGLNQLQAKNPIINLIGDVPLRLSMSIIGRARCVFCLDSGPLYIAQALRTPAVSLWTNIHPGVRIGYDKAYMETAVWAHEACNHAPCYAYRDFPIEKCPRHDRQHCCEVGMQIDSNQVLSKLDQVEKANPRKVSIT